MTNEEFELFISPEYQKDLRRINLYLLSINWTQTQIDSLILNIIKDAEKLSLSPFLGTTKVDYLKLRMIQTDKYLQFYRVNEIKKTIDMVRLFDVRENYLTSLKFN